MSPRSEEVRGAVVQIVGEMLVAVVVVVLVGEPGPVVPIAVGGAAAAGGGGFRGVVGGVGSS